MKETTKQMSELTDEKDLIVHLEIEKHIANIIGIQQSMNDSINLIIHNHNAMNLVIVNDISTELSTDVDISGNNEQRED
jgi:hypothetical protein